MNISKVQTKKLLLILTHGNGYTNEMEKINRDDSDMSIIITQETLLLLQKNEMACNCILSR